MKATTPKGTEPSGKGGYVISEINVIDQHGRVLLSKRPDDLGIGVKLLPGDELTITLHLAVPPDQPDFTETIEGVDLPPWHAYCGCYGCVQGDRMSRRIAKLARS